MTNNKENFPYPLKRPEKMTDFEHEISNNLARGDSFQEITNNFEEHGVPEGGNLRYFNHYKDGAKILKIAKERKIISQEISGHIVNLLRSNIGEISPSNKPPDYKANMKEFVSTLRQPAEKESDEIEKVLEEFSRVATPEIIMLNRQDVRGEKVPEEKKEVIKKYRDLDSKIFILSHDCPIRMFLYFYDNGDLKWIWGINDEDSFSNISTKSQGFRIADSQDVDW